MTTDHHSDFITGGVAGLFTALKLAENGHQNVTVLEVILFIEKNISKILHYSWSFVGKLKISGAAGCSVEQSCGLVF